MWFSTEVRPGIMVGFTDITAGNLAFHVSDDPGLVAGRRAVVDARVGTPGVALAYMNQVHGAEVAMMSGGERGAAAPTVDAMVLEPDGQACGLAVMVADCVPVVLIGEKPDGDPLLAVAHAGRPGVEAGVIDAVVARLRASGASSLEAWLGPSVCGACYEVPEDMRTQVSRQVPAASATTSWGTPALDLPAAVLAQLNTNGVRAHASGICTLEDSRYYSHRRSQRDGEPEGRFIGFVAATAR